MDLIIYHKNPLRPPLKELVSFAAGKTNAILTACGFYQPYTLDKVSVAKLLSPNLVNKRGVLYNEDPYNQQIQKKNDVNQKSSSLN